MNPSKHNPAIPAESRSRQQDNPHQQLTSQQQVQLDRFALPGCVGLEDERQEGQVASAPVLVINTQAPASLASLASDWEREHSMRSQAFVIYNLFIGPLAEAPLNLPADVRKPLVQFFSSGATSKSVTATQDIRGQIISAPESVAVSGVAPYPPSPGIPSSPSPLTSSPSLFPSSSSLKTCSHLSPPSPAAIALSKTSSSAALTLSPYIFDQAQKVILSLMYLDSYKRFVRTSAYRKLRTLMGQV